MLNGSVLADSNAASDRARGAGNRRRVIQHYCVSTSRGVD